MFFFGKKFGSKMLSRSLSDSPLAAIYLLTDNRRRFYS